MKFATYASFSKFFIFFVSCIMVRLKWKRVYAWILYTQIVLVKLNNTHTVFTLPIYTYIYVTLLKYYIDVLVI